ncbi:MAG: ABC transporter ATP-binding protein [Pseudomonadota bacterium]
MVEATPLIGGQGLCYAYNREPVVWDVDLEIHPGEMVGIVGPNGSGKSTLIGLLSGLVKPDGGRVFLNGKNIAAWKRPEAARLVGLVPQAPEIHPGLSVRETVLTGRFALMGRRMFENRADRRAGRKVLELTGLADLADRPAGALSGGERQRLALARALAAEPRVLLLDEPTSALDLDRQIKLMGLLEQYRARDGLAVGLVSHDLNLAAMFCDRLLLLARGKTLARGRPEEVIQPDILARAFGVEVAVDREPTRGRPRVTLIPPERP